MNIKLLNDRVCGISEIIKNITIQKTETHFLIDININDFNLNDDEMQDENLVGSVRAFKEFSDKIYKKFEISLDDLKSQFLDFGIVTFSYNFTFTNFQLINVNPETLINKKNITKYHEDLELVPMIIIFSPYKNCSIEECNIVVRHLKNIEVISNLEYSKEISNLSEFIYNDFPWGEEHYPKLIIPEYAKIGEKITFNLENIHNRPVYLETNIGVLNKTKLLSSSVIQLDLTSIVDTSEDVLIKMSYKYWTGIEEKRIKITS